MSENPLDIAKKASVGLVIYFTYTNPRGMLRASGRLVLHYGKQAITDVNAWRRIITEELVVPEVTAARTKGYPQAGAIWSVSPWIPFVMFGGILIDAFESVTCTVNGNTQFGACDGMEAIMLDTL